MRAQYEPGRTYEIGTINELIDVLRVLPEERRELMLREVMAGAQQAAAAYNMMETILGVPVDAGPAPLRWVDNVLTEAGADPLVSVTYGKAPAEPAQ